MKYTIKESELKSLVRKHIVEAIKQREKRSNEDRLKQFIKESIKRVLRESNEESILSYADKSSNEYKEGFQKGKTEARQAGNDNERNRLLDNKYFKLKKWQEAIDDGYPVEYIAEEPNCQWWFGWIDGVTQEFREADAYEELQNQDYGIGYGITDV